MSEGTPGTALDSRSIGSGSAAALIAANMVGTGAFTTSGFALADLGSRSAVVLAWGVGGLIALCGAWSYCELARRFPGSGGEYLFLSRGWHPLAGFLAGWVSLLAGFTAPIAAAAHGLEAYWSLPGWPPGSLGTTAILVAGLAHGVWPRSGLRLQNGAVALQMIALVSVLGIGLLAFSSPEWRPPPMEAAQMDGAGIDCLGAFAVTLVWISFAYSGWNAAIYVAGEVRGASFAVSKATMFGTGGIIVLYVGLNALFVFSRPVPELAGRAEVAALAAEAFAGPTARAVVSWVIGLGLWTSISAMVLVGPRIYAQMAEDGLLPAVLRAREGGLFRATGLQVSLALLVFWSTELRGLLLYVGCLLSVSAALAVYCGLRRPGMAGVRSPGASRDFQPARGVTRFASWVFILATLGSAGFLVVREPGQGVAALVTLALGAFVYALQTRPLRAASST